MRRGAAGYPVEVGDGDVAPGDGAVGDGDAVPRGPDGDGEGLTRTGAGERGANHWARGITGPSIGPPPARRKCRTTRMCWPPLTERVRRRRITCGAGPVRRSFCSAGRRAPPA